MTCVKHRCPIQRCGHAFYDWHGDGNPYMEDHFAARHFICSCGAVGVEWAKHVGQTRRFGTAWSGCRVVAWVWANRGA